MHRLVDPRPWNLFAGATLVAAGCGARTLGSDDGVTVTTNSMTEETGISIDSETDDGPECMSASDCPSGYYCYNGACEYEYHHDGHLDWYEYECYSDSECGPYALCHFNYCEPVETPGLCGAPLVGTPLPIPDGALALSFIDLDDDGAAELVAATPTELLVLESGSDVATVSARELDSDTLAAMVGGAFDMLPGDDALLHFESWLHLHPSNGVDGFASPTALPSPLAGLDMLAGDFDGQPPTDALIWGPDGAMVDRGGGDVLVLLVSPIEDAGAHPTAGFAVVTSSDQLRLFDLAGLETLSRTVYDGSPHALTSLDYADTPIALSSSRINADPDWTYLQAWDALTGNEMARWGLPGVVVDMRTGDLDGNGLDDVVLVTETSVWLHRDLFEPSSCAVELELGAGVDELAIGDHDGDGDDELALHLLDDTVLLFGG